MGFGDYDDGFAPNCVVADDFNHALGDAAERRLATALSYRVSGACPAGTSASEVAEKSLGSEPRLFRSPLRENRILLRRPLSEAPWGR